MHKFDGSRKEKRMGPKGALTALETKVATVVTVVRRLGFILLQALEASEKDLADAGYGATAETLRDELKPLCDALLHFEAPRQQEMFGGDDDGTA